MIKNSQRTISMRPFPLMAVFELPICPHAEHISFCDISFVDRVLLIKLDAQVHKNPDTKVSLAAPT